ncbi:RNA polymerase 1-1, isoform CRA_a [Rozella allomycis CSF55]|uniref:DNA-directed RNA polymerase, insert domain-containing protein n=1 Tax=Rozella allomycis (strain CSF55) TaxID=988480 RepID=A0A075AND0_ROZAC|nr:DNA-directed RNA polymerase, insert domain-containing protein [Rozella allomycis CSF55]RKP21301.1 RNA polymerase 1-1, isoform CRA_a [Rozella allomycis CSF55]RKP21304.1 RNA polymerase 1-1, isoform CRA_a [Rozella allomycis CSF55]|eukprot:EPZ31350.1 DNA-directed RNA polymerase, insert domain-containing protein [Rozella allomycis CSF55]
MASDSLRFLKENVVLEAERVHSTFSMDEPGVFHKRDDICDLQTLKEKAQIKIISEEENRLEFDLIGVDASFANALRRIIIDEIPTMAIEKVFFADNTGLMHEEMLAHRLGLVPIKADPSLFSERGPNEDATDYNTLVFTLNVKCERDPNDTSKLINEHVLSGHLVWSPQGGQEERFKDCAPEPAIKDIVITKLAENQEIELQAFCEKGIGQIHAKWSPVCTASYRLMPNIIMKEDVLGEEAVKFSNCFSPGVIEVVVVNGVKKAVVANPRNDSMSRECLRHKEFEDKVVLARKRDHFIFLVESDGRLSARRIVEDAFKVLTAKCENVKKYL